MLRPGRLLVGALLSGACASSSDGQFPPARRDATVVEVTPDVAGPRDQTSPDDQLPWDAGAPDAATVVRPPLTASSPERRLFVQHGVTMVVTPDKIRYGWGDRLGYAIGVANPAPVLRVMRVPWDDLRYEYSFTINEVVHPPFSYRACRRERSGRRAVQCWGANRYASLGRPDIEEYGFLPLPGDPPVIEGADRLITGDIGGCVGRSDGVWCWPRRPEGGIGVTPSPTDARPQRFSEANLCAFIPALTRAVTGDAGIECGYDCNSRQLLCRWQAYDVWGQRDPRTAEGFFVPVATLANVASISMTHGGNTFVSQDDGTLLCRGGCGGEVAGTRGAPHADFRPIRGLPPVAYAAGLSLPSETGGSWGTGMCVLLRDGTVRCWGLCPPWLGHYCNWMRPVLGPPMEVPNLHNVIELAVSETHACALTSSNEVWCWGDNRAHAVQPDGPADTMWEPVRVALPERP